jgi:membrane protein DedA with SNARE-associated domain
MSQFVASALDFLTHQPGWILFLITAVWLLAESVGIGLPIEPVLLLLGALAVRATPEDSLLALGVSLLVAMTGTVLGAVTGYIIGQRLGEGLPKFGRFVGLNQTRLDHFEVWLRRRGMPGVITARFVPVLRSYSPYVLGASNLRFDIFVAGTLIGSGAYELIWIILGYMFGKNYQAPLRYLDQYGWAGIGIIVALIALALVIRFVWESVSWRRLAAHFHLHPHLHKPSSQR